MKEKHKKTAKTEKYEIQSMLLNAFMCCADTSIKCVLNQAIKCRTENKKKNCVIIRKRE